MTEIYLHIFARTADYIATHPYHHTHSGEEGGHEVQSEGDNGHVGHLHAAIGLGQHICKLCGPAEAKDKLAQEAQLLRPAVKARMCMGLMTRW